MSTLEVLRDVLAAFEAAPAAPLEPEGTQTGVAVELLRAVARLSPEARNGLRQGAREIESALADALRRIAEQSNDPAIAQLIAEALPPSRVGDLTPTRDAVTAAFARATARAIAASRAAALPVHAMSDGRVVQVPPHDK